MIKGHHEFRRLIGLCCPLVALISGNLNLVGANAPRHYVFAHYMVCFATYGETLDGYKREIQDAQAAGIDGFALNVGAWSGPDTYYKSRVELIYDAAEQLGTNFKLFFSIDFANTNDIVDMLSAYGPRTNSFRIMGTSSTNSPLPNAIPSEGKVVLSSFGQNNLDWQGSVFTPLKAKGIQLFFVPHFWPNPVTELPDYQGAVGILNTYSNILDGLFLFGAAGLPYQLAQCNSNYTKAVHAAGKIFMASYTPNYWGCGQTSNGRRYYESDGGEGTVLQWNSIIANQPDWVEIVTWNDFNESTYVSPIENPAAFFSALAAPVRNCHKGYLELSRRYISWYKTGQQTPINQDALYYFYRTHPLNAVASNTNDVPVTTFFGDVADVIYTTTFLTASAQLEISTGGTLVTNSLPAGMTHLRTPFSPGPQKFTVRRNGSVVTSVQGPDILSQIQVYDYFPASGRVYYPPNPPANLRVLSP
jgi:glucan endo-1,3-alpha-glucosidase